MAHIVWWRHHDENGGLITEAEAPTLPIIVLSQEENSVSATDSETLIDWEYA